MLQTLEETLKLEGGGNAGGNMSDELQAQVTEWAKLYERANRLCRQLTKLTD